jgi:hypothetical protein
MERRAKATQIALGLISEIEGMASAAEADFQIAQLNVDSVKLGPDHWDSAHRL